MEMDMMMVVFSEKERLNQDEMIQVKNRLKRMEEEFDTLVNRIRQASMQADQEQDQEHWNLGDFLEDMVSRQQANLYYKHHVLNEIVVEDDLPTLGDLPREFPNGLSWFFQSIVEELEKQHAERITLKIRKGDTGTEIIFVIPQGGLSDDFIKELSMDRYVAPPFKLSKDHPMITPAMLVFQSCGASIQNSMDGMDFKIALQINSVRRNRPV
jgi:hypothetical protein